MAEYSPDDPRDGFDLERHPTSRFAHFAADRHNPSGIQHDVALQLAWRTSEITPRRRPGMPHGQWSGLPGPDESDHPCGDETAGGSILAG